jgi:DNA gyrase inhibitor GyrI
VRDDLVRIVTAGPFRVAVFHAFGAEPEPEAYDKLSAWARPRGLLDEPSSYLLLGRNDPPPPRAGGEYGYRYMLTLPENADIEQEVTVESLSRSTYAVVRSGLRDMGSRWLALYEWAEGRGYTVSGHGVEEHLALPDGEAVEALTFDLWLPVGGPA